MKTISGSNTLASALFSLALAVACSEAGGSSEPMPDVAVVTEALSDSCNPACGPGQMCCNSACIPRVVGTVIPGSNITPLAQKNGVTGCLEYRAYASRASVAPEPGAVQSLPDFSYAGYLGGGKAIPWAPVKAEVVAEDPGDDRQRIQDAIAAVGSLPRVNGIRGAVLIRRGTYDIDGAIVIDKDGVILRGEGQGSGGTILRSVRPAPEDVEGSALIQVLSPSPVEGASAPIDSASGSFAVPVGARQLSVLASSVMFSPGERVFIRRTPNQAWVDAIGMNGSEPWDYHDFARDYERTIVDVGLFSGPPVRELLTFDVPLVDAIESRFGGGQVVKITVPTDVVQNVGIERLRLDSLNFQSTTDEEHTQDGIVMVAARNSWVRQVTLLHFIQKGINFGGASQSITVEDVAVLDPISTIDGGRRYPFSIYSGGGILFQRCYARNGRHNFVTHGNANGPNVWLDCATNFQWDDDGPHAWWATGILYDNIETGRLHVQNALNVDSNHGWRGAQVLFWNSEVTDVCPGGGQPGDIECPAFRSQQPPGAMNWGVGNKGPKYPGRWTSDPFGLWQSEGVFVNPRSLYIQQLQDRLGAAAVNAVTTPDQSTRMGKKLRLWEGEGDITPDKTCSRGDIHNGACCPKSCGGCGGQGCSQHDGSVDGCCTGYILASGRSCLDYGPPCAMPTSDPKCKTGTQLLSNGFSICCVPGSGNCFAQTAGRFCSGSMPPCKLADAACTTGIPSTTSERACCPLICGRCGGQACSSLPDNNATADECCKGYIQGLGRSCANYPPPCVMP